MTFDYVNYEGLDHFYGNLKTFLSTKYTTKEELEQAIANFGGFQVVSLNQQGYPDVATPSTKVIYLTKEASSSKTDPYTEWICTNTTGPVWEVIGETTPEIHEMIGATASTDGASGLVPAPKAGDENKVLKGDGTWLELNLNSYVTESNIGDIVASLYSSSSTYTVNSYAIKDNKLYRCTTAISQAEEWTPAHWTPAKTTDLFNGSAPGLIPSASVVDDKHILTANGSWLELEEVTDNDIDALFNGNTVTIGGREYPFVRIGDYYWMTENLDWKAPGISINPPPNTEPYQPKAAWYYVDEATNGVRGNKYGLLYNAHALDDVEFPTGWHIPTEAELLDLLLTAGGAAALMSTTSDWNTSVTGTNTTGFTALPSGMYSYADNSDGPYYAGYHAYIMSSTFVDHDAMYKYLNIPDNTSSLSSVYKMCGASVRLCKHV